MTLSPDQDGGRKRFGPFHLYQKNNTKSNNQPKSFSLSYTSFGFLTNKKVIYLPATVQAGQTQNRHIHSSSTYEALCVSDSVSVWIKNLALHKIYDFRFQRDRLELIRRMK